jgi:hypothetical protein
MARFLCKCSICSKKIGPQWVAIRTLRRHAHADLHRLLRAHDREDEGPRSDPGPVHGQPAHADDCSAMDDDVPDIAPACHDDTGSESEDADMDDVCSAADIFSLPKFEKWGEELDVDPAEGPKILIGELLLIFFEWMCVHKPSNECARAVHTMISLLAPPGASNMPGWAEVHSMLDIVYNNVVVEVDICPNDCIAFVDAKHPKLQEAGYMHAHRSSCPRCGAARYKREDEPGHKVPVKKGYYFPIDTFVSTIFRDEKTYENRQHTTGQFPPGNVRHSRGFYEKVTSNSHMNKESRNQAFIGMADGIPLFRSRTTSLGVVVGALRQANQPDHISKMFSKVHLSFLYPCEYWVEDKDTKEPILQKSKPSNLSPLIMMLVDDLLHWYDGKLVTDYSMSPDDPAREALIRCILLFWCGDYPGLGEASNFSHSAMSSHACHWCNVKSDYSMSMRRQVYGGYRR